MKDLLIRHAKRHARDAALSLVTAAAGALVAEGIKRALPEIQIDSGSDMAFLCRILAEKPGAPKGPMTQDGDRDRWSFGFGHLIFQHGGHWFYAARTPERQGGNGDVAKAEYPSTVSYKKMLGRQETGGFLYVRALTGGEASLKMLLADARSRFIPDKEVSVYNWEGHWRHLDHRPPRPLATVAVEGNLAERLLADIAAFKADEAWYKSHYVPYRRGYLLHGPPGSGKSTLAAALAAEAELNVCVLSLANKNLDDNAFLEALRQMPKNSMLLLEDVDAVNAQTERRAPAQYEYDTFPALMTSGGDEDESSGDWVAKSVSFPPNIVGLSQRGGGSLTLAGILNGLDGLTTPSGLIVMMTTNHREQLDPALIRPGRVDVHAEIGLATRAQVHDLFLRFFPDHGHLADGFVGTVTPGTTSPAAIQEHLVRHRYEPEKAAQGIQAFI